MDNRTRFGWNNAYSYIMGIKDAYVAKFGQMDTYSCIEMAQRLQTDEYSNFLRCTDIHVCGALNGFKYSLIKGGKTDLYANPDSIYREMRGLVINMETEEIVVAPFRKFFNINEIPETSLNGKSPTSWTGPWYRYAGMTDRFSLRARAALTRAFPSACRKRRAG